MRKHLSFLIVGLVLLVIGIPAHAQRRRIVPRPRPNPATVAQRLQSAWGHLDRKQYNDAITLFDQHIKEDPKSVDAYHGRGVANFEKGEFEKAVADFTQAIRLDPNTASRYEWRGDAYLWKMDLEKALADYDTAIVVDPKAVGPHCGRGFLFLGKEEYDKALAEFDRALRLNPRYADALFGRGAVFQEQKQYEKAVAAYGEVLRLTPKDDVTLSTLGWLLATCPEAKVRNGAKALEYAARACALSDDAPEDVESLAAAYAEVGEFAEAAKRQKEALEAGLDKDDEKKRERAKARLALYEQKKPYRLEK